MANESTILPLLSCHLIDLPNGNKDCSTTAAEGCLECLFVGRFLVNANEGMEDYDSLGHVLCFIQGIFVTLVGSFGTIANLLIIIILNRQKSTRGFDTLLVGLACFDLICSVFSVMAAISAISYFQNMSRGLPSVVGFYAGVLTALFGRSGSSFMTVVISAERYLVLAFPARMGNWFTKRNCKWLVIAVLIFSCITAIPRYSSVYITKNTIGKNIASTKSLDYLIMATPLERVWYFTLGGFFDLIDFWAPLPLLLVWNFMTFIELRKFAGRRKALKLKSSKEIRAARMFINIVVVLLLCQIVPIVHYILIFGKNVYRELYFGMILSFAVNSAVNLPVYYFKGSSFRRETRDLIISWFPSLESYLVAGRGTGGTTVTTGTSESVGQSVESSDNEKP